MKNEEILKDLSGEIIVDMDSWNKSHPDATFLDIEEKARELASKLEVVLIQNSALEREEDSWKDMDEEDRPICPHCKIPINARGKRMMRLQGTQGQEIRLKRTYGTCPNCGVGFFPPR